MADNIKLTYEGGEQILRRLKELDLKMRTKIMQRSLAAGAGVARRAARKFAPTRSRNALPKRHEDGFRAAGNLKRSIAGKKVRGKMRYEVGPKRSGWYGRLLERGARSSGVRGGVLPRRPWLGPSWASSGQKAFTHIGRRFEQLLAKEAKRRG